MSAITFSSSGLFGSAVMRCCERQGVCAVRFTGTGISSTSEDDCLKCSAAVDADPDSSAVALINATTVTSVTPCRCVSSAWNSFIIVMISLVGRRSDRPYGFQSIQSITREAARTVNHGWTISSPSVRRCTVSYTSIPCRKSSPRKDFACA